MTDLEHIMGKKMASAVGTAFDLMGIAEEEIAAEIDRLTDDAARDRVWNSFSALQPSDGMSGQSHSVYRAHAREIVKRAGRDESLVEPTNAELLTFLSESSLRAPLKNDSGVLYHHVFERIFPDADVVVPGDEQYESYPNAAAEIEADIRRALRQPNRRIRSKRELLEGGNG